MSNVQGEVEIAVHPCLSPDEGIDAPASGDERPQTGGVQGREHA